MAGRPRAESRRRPECDPLAVLLSRRSSSPSLATSALAAGSPPPRRSSSPGLVSTGFDDAHVSFSPDGQTLYFLRSTPDFAHWTVLVSRRAGARWGPAEVAPFSGRWNDGDVTITRDGRRLFFISNRPVEGDAPRPDTEIWTMERTGSGVGPAPARGRALQPGRRVVPDHDRRRDPVLRLGAAWREGQVRPVAGPMAGDHFAPPENLGEPINTSDQEIEPWISPDGRMLVFAGKGRRDGAGRVRPVRHLPLRRTWTEPRPLGAGVNSAGWDFGPRFSPDGRTFFFTSNRSDWPACAAASR